MIEALLKLLKNTVHHKITQRLLISGAACYRAYISLRISLLFVRILLHRTGCLNASIHIYNIFLS